MKTSQYKKGKNADSKKYYLSAQNLHMSRMFYMLKLNILYLYFNESPFKVIV